MPMADPRTPQKNVAGSRSSMTPRDRPPSKGLLSDGKWYCDCDPRLEAIFLETTKEGKNHGKWFYRCQKQRCGFFLWADHAERREAQTVLATGRGEGSVARTPNALAASAGLVLGAGAARGIRAVDEQGNLHPDMIEFLGDISESAQARRAARQETQKRSMDAIAAANKQAQAKPGTPKQAKISDFMSPHGRRAQSASGTPGKKGETEPAMVQGGRRPVPRQRIFGTGKRQEIDFSSSSRTKSDSSETEASSGDEVEVETRPKATNSRNGGDFARGSDSVTLSSATTDWSHGSSSRTAAVPAGAAGQPPQSAKRKRPLEDDGEFSDSDIDSETERALIALTDNVHHPTIQGEQEPQLLQDATTPTAQRHGAVVADGLPTPMTERIALRTKDTQATPSKRVRFSSPSSAYNLHSDGESNGPGDDYDVTSDVMSLLRDAGLPAETKEAVRDTLNTYALRVRGVHRGRDMVRTLLKKRDLQVAELQERIKSLEEARQMDRLVRR